MCTSIISPRAWGGHQKASPGLAYQGLWESQQVDPQRGHLPPSFLLPFRSWWPAGSVMWPVERPFMGHSRVTEKWLSTEPHSHNSCLEQVAQALVCIWMPSVRTDSTLPGTLVHSVQKKCSGHFRKQVTTLHSGNPKRNRGEWLLCFRSCQKVK